MNKDQLIDERKRIGAAIRARRELLGMTHQALADATGLKRQNITRVEQGLYSTGIDLINRVCAVLGMELSVITKE